MNEESQNIGASYGLGIGALRKNSTNPIQNQEDLSSYI
jgi:hypothetical protein